MPKKWIIANWKMHGDLAFVQQWAAEFSLSPQAQERCTAVVCPPFPYLSAVREALSPAVLLGGQNISPVTQDGAHTGEVSAQMLSDVGCCLTLIGHSERRAAGETNADCAAKLTAAAAAGLRPVLCIGEDEKTRNAGGAAAVAAVLAQLEASCAQMSPQNWQNLIIAYEPIWAIGSGVTPSAEDISIINTALRSKLIEKTAAFGDTIEVLYGGSVTPAVAEKLNGIADGFLVGGASLQPQLFADICATSEQEWKYSSYL